MEVDWVQIYKRKGFPLTDSVQFLQKRILCSVYTVFAVCWSFQAANHSRNRFSKLTLVNQFAETSGNFCMTVGPQKSSWVMVLNLCPFKNM